MSEGASATSGRASPEAAGYVIPRYRAEGAALYHFLHGTVPGHQIDFMYCPEVPQGALRQTHVGHLARLIKYIEPRESATYAFAIGNLSRDDVQHGPGHGGLAVLFALRVPGVVDHAGRDTPPYAHGVVAVDRHLDYVTLLETTTVLYQRFLERAGAEDRRGDFYRSYVRTVREAPDEVAGFLAQALTEFDDLPSPRKSTLGWDYAADESEPPRHIAIVHDEPMEFGTIAHWASALAALLYRSNIKWTSISTGREIDIAGGTTIRFVPRSEVHGGLRGLSFELDDLPDEEDALAIMLFGAKRRGTAAPAPRQGWREAMAAQRAGHSEPPPNGAGVGAEGDLQVEIEVDDAAATIPVASPLEAARGFDPRRSSPVVGQRAVDLHAAGMGVGAGAGGAVGTGAAAGAAGPGAPPSVPSGAMQGGSGQGKSTPARGTVGGPGSQDVHSAIAGGASAAAVAAAATANARIAAMESRETAIGAGGRAAPRGRWIIIAAALAAVAVVVMVVIAAGMSGEGSGASGSETASGMESSNSVGSASGPGSSGGVATPSTSSTGASSGGLVAPGSSGGPPAGSTTAVGKPSATGTGKVPPVSTKTKTTAKPLGTTIKPPVF